MRIQQPLPTLTRRRTGIGHPGHIQHAFTRGFNIATVAPLYTAFGRNVPVDARRVIGPHHHQAAIAPQIGIGIQRGAAGYVGELAVDDVRVQALPAATDQNFATTQVARRIQPGPIAHNHSTTGTDANAAAHTTAPGRAGGCGGVNWQGRCTGCRPRWHRRTWRSRYRQLGATRHRHASHQAGRSAQCNIGQTRMANGFIPGSGSGSTTHRR